MSAFGIKEEGNYRNFSNLTYTLSVTKSVKK